MGNRLRGTVFGFLRRLSHRQAQDIINQRAMDNVHEWFDYKDNSRIHQIKPAKWFHPGSFCQPRETLTEK